MRFGLSALAMIGAVMAVLSVGPACAEAHRHAGPGAHATPKRASVGAPRSAHGHGTHHSNDSHAHEIESENLFGFTTGSDTGDAGTVGLAFESVARLGKREGRYTGLGKKLELGYGVTDDLSVSIGLLTDYHRIVGVAGLDDVRNFGFNGVGGELRWRLIKRGPAPVGVTLHTEAAGHRYDESTGQRATSHGVENKLIFDTELVADRVFAAINLLYSLQRVRERGRPDWEEGSTIGLAAAMTMQVAPQAFVGAELRYLRAYEGLLPKTFAGDAWFVGPTVFRHLPNHMWLAAAWNIQVAGRAAGHAGRLDLVNFERHQLRFKFGIDFEPEKDARR
jgi:hypothetical protein